MGVRNPQRLLSAVEVRGLVDRLAGGDVGQFSKAYGVSGSTIYDWLAKGVSRSANKANRDGLNRALDDSAEIEATGKAPITRASAERMIAEMTGALQLLPVEDVQAIWANVMDLATAAMVRRRTDAARAALAQINTGLSEGEAPAEAARLLADAEARQPKSEAERPGGKDGGTQRRAS